LRDHSDMAVADQDNVRMLKERDPKLYANLEGHVQYITKLYTAEFHVLARNDIKSYSDLKGQKVNFNLKDSQTDVTADRDGKDLILTVNGTNEQIRVVGEFTGIKPGLFGGNLNDKAGVQQGAKRVTFGGMDGPVSDKTPDFVKALDLDHARDGEVMLAYGMNGEDLPVLNGFPLRLVVPGYYGTYWVKHLNEITVIDNVFDGFWMKTAYRIPDTPCGCIEPGTAPKATIPINRFTVRSFITNVTMAQN